MTMIKVTIDKEANTISVWNNGKGLPVQMHQTEKVYVPELVFGHLLTSSNFDDSVKKVTGGRNGFGAKLTNIFSKKLAFIFVGIFLYSNREHQIARLIFHLFWLELRVLLTKMETSNYCSFIRKYHSLFNFC